MAESVKIKVNIQRTEEILIPDKMPILVDKKTQVKSVSFPFQFSDGIPGFLTVTRLVKLGWQPSNDIEKVTIIFK